MIGGISVRIPIKYSNLVNITLFIFKNYPKWRIDRDSVNLFSKLN